VATIIFAIADSISHYNASYKIANQLRQEGHTVIYLSDSTKRKKEVTGQQFRFEVIYDDLFKETKDRKASYMEKVRNLVSYKSALMTGDELKKVIDKFRPDLFVIDVFHYIHAAALYKFGVRTILLQTYVATDKDPDIPPLNSGLIPGHLPASGLVVEFLWWRLFLRRSLRDIFYKVALFGHDKKSIFQAVARQNGLKRSAINYRRTFHPGIDDLPELVLCASEFDFPRKKRKNRHYVGPMVEMDRRDVLYDPGYLDLMLEREIAGLPDPGTAGARHLVYCSLGTLNVSWYRYSHRFFRMLIDAFGNSPKYELLVAIGTDIKPGIFGFLPENVHMFQLVPQLDVLEKASLMITHGGINSINVFFQVSP